MRVEERAPHRLHRRGKMGGSRSGNDGEWTCPGPEGIARCRRSPLPRPSRRLVPASKRRPSGPRRSPPPSPPLRYRAPTRGTPSFAGASSLARSPHLRAPGGCASACPCACLVPARAPGLPAFPAPITSRGCGAGSTAGRWGSGLLDSGCSNRGEKASGSAPSAEPHSSRAGPLLFAAFPAPPRPPGRREGGREGVTEKASEEAERGAADSGSTGAELPGGAATADKAAAPPRAWGIPTPLLAPPSLTRGAQSLPLLPAYTHTLSPDAPVRAWPHSTGRWPEFLSPALESPKLPGGCADPDLGSRDPGSKWSFFFASVSPQSAGWLEDALDKTKKELKTNFSRWAVSRRALSQSAPQGTGNQREKLPSGWLGFQPPPSFAPAPWEGSALVSEFGPSRGSCSPKDLQPAPCCP